MMKIFGVVCATQVLLATGFQMLRKTNSRQRRTQLQSSGKITVALTREDGKNGKLRTLLQQDDGLNIIELPCIEHGDGKDYPLLKDHLRQSWDYIAVTSPEAARILSTAWEDCGHPIAAVGKATEKALQDFGMEVDFVPSKALACQLVKELPGSGRVLYPASAKAKKVLQDGLKERGFEVTRLNTYDTVSANWTAEQLLAAEGCQVVCFGSPSAIKGWMQNTRKEVKAACIGQTSADACYELGWNPDDVFYPEKPGMEGWVAAVKDATCALVKVQQE